MTVSATQARLPFAEPAEPSGLKLVQVLEEWDMPILVALEDDGGRSYLGVVIEETRSYDTWLIAQCTPSVLMGVLSGQTEYAHAFSGALRAGFLTFRFADRASVFEEASGPVEASSTRSRG